MRLARRLALGLTASCLACAPAPADDDGETGGATEDTAAETGGPAPFLPEIGDDATITAFEQTHVYFLGDDNQRAIDTEVEFPPSALAYESVTLELELGCPNGLCDWWDRIGWIAVVENPGSDDEQLHEVARFMTPYRVGAQHHIDVTEIRPLLAGTVTLRVFIDTWVGPGHQNGDGWLVDASFVFVGGAPQRVPIATLPVWNLGSFEYGNPEAPVAGSVPEAAVEIPADADAVSLRALITGHGQGNLDNCAEFCPRNHGFLVGGQPFLRQIWRDDCSQTPVEGQQGTWQLSRAGWCPGAEVIPWIEELGDAAVAGESVSVVYDVQPYENTCRPDAPVCTGCALGTGCDYDGGNHTMPIYEFSTMLVAWRDVGEP